MKTLVLAATALLLAAPTFAQYSARTLTRKVVPQSQQPAQTARPTYAAPAQPAAPPRELTPEEAKKAQIQQNKNDVKQFEYYKRRAEEGSDHAQFELGTRYFTGKGVVKNQKLAREWLGKSAKQGNAKAAKQLAELGPEPTSVATEKSAKAAIPASAAKK